MDTIGIIIPSHNRKETTLRCLEALQQIKEDAFATKIYLVDDGSTDGTAYEVTKLFEDKVEIISGDGNLFWTGAVNKGINRALRDKCDYLLFLNDDISFQRDFILQLYKSIKNKKRAIIGSITYDEKCKGVIIKSGMKLVSDFKQPVVPITTSFQSDTNREINYPVDILSGRSLIMPSKIIQEIGYLDQRRFPHGFADYEFCLRAKRFGYDIIVNPRSVIYTQVEPNFTKRLIGKTKLKAVMDIWCNKNYFGIKTGYYKALELNKNPFLCFSYDTTRLIKWSILRLICSKERFIYYRKKKESPHERLIL